MNCISTPRPAVYVPASSYVPQIFRNGCFEYHVEAPEKRTTLSCRPFQKAGRVGTHQVSRRHAGSSPVATRRSPRAHRPRVARRNGHVGLREGYARASTDGSCRRCHSHHIVVLPFHRVLRLHPQSDLVSGKHLERASLANVQRGAAMSPLSTSHLLFRHDSRQWRWRRTDRVLE